MQTFPVCHALRCPSGGTVITHHNEICDEIIHLAKQYFFPNYIHGKPLIHLGHSRSEEEVRHGGRVPETWGDVSIQGPWESQKETIIDIRFGDADVDT